MRSRAEDRRASHTAPAGALGSAKDLSAELGALRRVSQQHSLV